jgi:hypothetical protein
MPNNKLDDFDDLIDPDLHFLIISDDDFICGNCKHCTNDVISCSKFESRKPMSFLFNQCDEFTPKDSQ